MIINANSKYGQQATHRLAEAESLHRRALAFDEEKTECCQEKPMPRADLCRTIVTSAFLSLAIAACNSGKGGTGRASGGASGSGGSHPSTGGAVTGGTVGSGGAIGQDFRTFPDGSVATLRGGASPSASKQKEL